jgi:uncharacterized membrane protein
MSQTIEQYLAQLKELLKDHDPAIIRDALSDTEEHLRSAMVGQELDALQSIIDEYGTPEETAAAYAIMEERLSPGLGISKGRSKKNWMARFFGIFADPRAWSALLFALISFVTGTIYFCWVMTGLSVSISMSILIFGVPLAALILLSFRGLAWFEGRIVEALLGERMPRRPVFTRKDVTPVEKLKTIFSSRVTWFSTLYLFLQFPLGVLHFCLTIALSSVGLSLVALPLLRYISWRSDTFDLGGPVILYSRLWIPVFMLAGVILLTLTMHLGKGLGWVRGKLARALLVVE